jgi:hypothetical protein
MLADDAENAHKWNASLSEEQFAWMAHEIEQAKAEQGIVNWPSG